MSENSVKDILARFNQGNGPPVGMRPGQPPIATKPGKPSKPDNLSPNKDHSHEKRSPIRGKVPGGGPPTGLNFDITSVKLRKPPLPKTPDERRLSQKEETPEWLAKPALTKPKPPTPVRGDSGVSSSSSPLPSPAHLKSPSQPKSFAHLPAPSHNESSLHPKPLTKATPVPGKKPRPPPPSRKDSVQKPGSPTVPNKPGWRAGRDENKENRLRNGFEEEPIPPVSDSENSSASSITDMAPRRTSFLHSSKSKPLKPLRRPLPPLEIIGKPPRKHTQPPNVSLARFQSTPGPPLPSKHGLPPPSPGAPALPARPSGGKPKPNPPIPVPEEGADDSGEIYDDVEGDNPAPAPPPMRRARPFSLIQTMDSDEEEVTQEGDEIYDDTDTTPAPPVLPPHPPHSSHSPHPSLTVRPASGGEAPPLPSIATIPALHGSGGSSISVPRSTEHSGSGIEDPEIYDDVSAGDCDELYEALDIDEGSAEADSPRENEQPKKPQDDKKKKEEERLRREQEKQQKKEEEKRKKKEKEDKKKKEKEEKDMRKKFNFKGDFNILDEGIVIEAMEAVYEKLDLQCKAGEKIEIIRKDGNPPGKWLARNPSGHYGYVDHQFVRVGGSSGDTSEDFGDVYDDVMGAQEASPQPEPEPEIASEDDEDNIYDAVN